MGPTDVHRRPQMSTDPISKKSRIAIQQLSSPGSDTKERSEPELESSNANVAWLVSFLEVWNTLQQMHYRCTTDAQLGMSIQLVSFPGQLGWLVGLVPPWLWTPQTSLLWNKSRLPSRLPSRLDISLRCLKLQLKMLDGRAKSRIVGNTMK